MGKLAGMHTREKPKHTIMHSFEVRVEYKVTRYDTIRVDLTQEQCLSHESMWRHLENAAKEHASNSDTNLWDQDDDPEVSYDYDEII